MSSLRARNCCLHIVTLIKRSSFATYVSASWTAQHLAAQVRSSSHCVHSVTNKTETGELFYAFFAFRPDFCKLFLSFICPLIPPFTLGTFSAVYFRHIQMHYRNSHSWPGALSFAPLHFPRPSIQTFRAFLLPCRSTHIVNEDRSLRERCVRLGKDQKRGKISTELT